MLTGQPKNMPKMIGSFANGEHFVIELDLQTFSTR